MHNALGRAAECACRIAGRRKQQGRASRDRAAPDQRSDQRSAGGDRRRIVATSEPSVIARRLAAGCPGGLDCRAKQGSPIPAVRGTTGGSLRRRSRSHRNDNTSRTRASRRGGMPNWRIDGITSGLRHDRLLTERCQQPGVMSVADNHSHRRDTMRTDLSTNLRDALCASNPGPESGSRWVLVTVCLAVLLAQVDTSVVNLALRSIGQGLQVAVTRPAMGARCLQPRLCGAAADRRTAVRPVWTAALFIWARRSSPAGPWCAPRRPTSSLLIAGRAVAGAGAALLLPASLAIIRVDVDRGAGAQPRIRNMGRLQRAGIHHRPGIRRRVGRWVRLAQRVPDRRPARRGRDRASHCAWWRSPAIRQGGKFDASGQISGAL